KQIHAADLRRVRSIWVDVKPTWDARWEGRNESGEVPPALSASIRTHVDGPAVGLTVEGPRRTEVDGLAVRISEIFDRGRGPLPFDPGWLTAIVWPVLLVSGFAVGPAVARWLGFGKINGRWDPGEIVGLVVGPMVGVVLGYAIWKVLPTFELVE